MPNSQPAFSVRSANWHDDQAAMMNIRHEVFVVEQLVPAELEQDSSDPIFRHVIALDANGDPIGTGRASANLGEALGMSAKSINEEASRNIIQLRAITSKLDRAQAAY